MGRIIWPEYRVHNQTRVICPLAVECNVSALVYVRDIELREEFKEMYLQQEVIQWI